MADRKITDLQNLGTPANNDLISAVDASDGLNKKLQVEDLFNSPLATSQTVVDNRINQLTFDWALAANSDELPVNKIPDLPAAKITSDTFSTARIPNLPASKTTSGTFTTARIPNLSANKITSGTLNSNRVPNLDASKITTGVFDAARIPTSSGRQARTHIANATNVGQIDNPSVAARLVIGNVSAYTYVIFLLKDSASIRHYTFFAEDVEGLLDSSNSDITSLRCPIVINNDDPGDLIMNRSNDTTLNLWITPSSVGGRFDDGADSVRAYGI